MLKPDNNIGVDDADATFGKGDQDLMKKKMVLGAMDYDDAE